MTTLAVERVMPGEHFTRDGQRVRVVVPVAQATDAEFDSFFAEQLRELLHRHGVPTPTLTDAVLVAQTIRTYTPHARHANR